MSATLVGDNVVVVVIVKPTFLYSLEAVLPIILFVVLIYTFFESFKIMAAALELYKLAREPNVKNKSIRLYRRIMKYVLRRRKNPGVMLR
jgi:hypothetical protein